ncbi:hypothetical protein L7F22_062606 [Adiantum nelumboides]|nr:hypothetical protein [Adiantum nelumboides]
MDTRSVEDVAGSSTGAGVVCNTTAAAACAVLPTAEQIHCNSIDRQTHAMISLSIKYNITLYICSTKITKQAWDILGGMYAGQNEAKISYLHKELELKIMLEDDEMNNFFAKIKDLQEQLIFIDEAIPDHSFVQTVLDAPPKSYQTFVSTWRLVTEDRLDAIDMIH